MTRLRRVRTHTMALGAAPETVFPLLCPVREREWVEPWACRMIYSRSGFAELDCVFQTDFPKDGPTDTWVVSRYEPPQLIEFVRVNSLRTIRYTITLRPTGAGKTEAEWRQVVTPLTQEGDHLLQQGPPEAYRAQMERLAEMLNHFLETGERLSCAAD